MKLLDTIQKLITEAENDLYNASVNPTEFEEIEKIQSNLDESIRILEIYKNLY